MTTEELAAELDHRFAEQQAKIQALVAGFSEPLAEANRIQAAAEERQKREADLYNKRAAEHDAQAKAQHERAVETLNLQRRNVEAWERIASALERLAPFNFSSSFAAAPFGGYDNCTCVLPQPSTDATRCGLCGKRRT